MVYALDTRTTTPSIAVSRGELVSVEQPGLPATTSSATTLQVLDQQSRFGSLMETRGSKPAPVRPLARLFSHDPSWALVSLGAGVLAAAPAGLLFGEIGAFVGLASTVVATFMTAMITCTGMSDTGGPLRLLARHKHLTANDLAFVGDSAEKTPIEQATLGLLAERWMARINAQSVHGDEAYATLERIAVEARKLPADVRESAERVMVLRDAMLDPTSGQPWRELSDVSIPTLIAAFQALPESERHAVGPELTKRYFKGEVPKVKVGRHESGRALYRALRDCGPRNAE